MRCVHEASLYDDNCFITLTYDDKHLPPGGTLVKKDFQDFMKRLRFKFSPRRIRFYQCGEYGETTSRPHYHACLFNLDFTDKVPYSGRDGVTLYTSETLEKLWGKGFATVGAVTFDSAAYVARYIMKKITGEKAEEHYQSVIEETGELFTIIPEYTCMSRDGGIGKEWYEKWKADAYPEDQIIMNGKRMKPPRFYDGLFEQENPKIHQEIKTRRKKFAASRQEDQTRERLAVREKVKQNQIKNLKRNHDK